MNLGSLVTIAEAAPANLIHFVFENGTYESNGSHPIPGQNRVDFAGIARAAGYKEAFTFSEINSFKNDMPDILNKTGPVFIDLKVCSGPQYPQAYDVIHSRTVREEFKKALNT